MVNHSPVSSGNMTNEEAVLFGNMIGAPVASTNPVLVDHVEFDHDPAHESLHDLNTLTVPESRERSSWALAGANFG